MTENVLRLIIILILGKLSYDYKFDDFHLLLTFFNILGSFLFFRFVRYKGLINCISSIFVYIYILFSTQVQALFQVQSLNIKMICYTEQEFKFLANFGTELLAIYLVGLFIFRSFFSYNYNIQYVPNTNYKVISDKYFYICVIIAFSLSFISAVLGIGRMGGELVKLPFHLTGIINFMRMNVFPTLLMLYIYDVLSHNEKIKSNKYLIIFIWGIFEVFVRLSKSALITSILPSLIIIILSEKINKKHIIRIIVPLIVVFLFMYPIIETMRYSKETSMSSLISAYESVNSGENDGSSPFTRIFMTGPKYLNALPVINDNKLFDFSKAPIILKIGGSAAYTTFIIDGYAQGVRHNSGCTGIIDPLLFGGYGLCYIVVFLFSIFSLWIDSPKIRGNVMLRTLLLLLFIDVVMKKNISLFIDALAFPYWFITFIQFIIVCKYLNMNFEKRINLI